MSKPGRTYYPTTTKTGRRIMSATSKILSVFKRTDEVAEWNKAVDAKKKIKLANKGRTK